jgi:hypothetical protein
MSEHAKLSASGSERWILCPGSVKAEDGIVEKPNPYAEEGTLAHEVAAKVLMSNVYDNDVSIEECASILDNIFESFPNIIEMDMTDNIQKYIGYIKNVALDNYNDNRYIEQRVDFSHIVPGGFGTADCIIKTNNVLHVIDLKYGKGVPVYAENNTQLLLYAIGALNRFPEYSPAAITMHIVQPRIGNYSEWSITRNELDEWVEFLRGKALEALKPDAKRIPHKDACRWCKAKPTCPALYNFIDHSIMPLKDKTMLTDEETKLVLDNTKLITDFLSSVEQSVYDRLMSGEPFKGYKLVNGRSMRKFKADSLEFLGDAMYKKVPITLAEAEKLLSKDVINEITYKQESKPILTTEDDKRPSISNFEFDDETKIDTIKAYQKNYRNKKKQVTAVVETLKEDSFKY